MDSSKRRRQKKLYVQKNRFILNRKQLLYVRKCLGAWIGIVPKTANCQVCGKVINLMDKVSPIVFDHRHGGNEPIQGSPTGWLISHKRTPKNEEIWKSCDFGLLCRRCNYFLPTKDRKDFLEKVLQYCQ